MVSSYDIEMINHIYIFTTLVALYGSYVITTRNIVRSEKKCWKINISVMPDTHIYDIRYY